MSVQNIPVCPNCGSDVVRKSANGPIPTYCSRRCMHTAWVRRKYQSDPAAGAARVRAFRAANPGSVSETQRRWREAHVALRRELWQRWYKKNREQQVERSILANRVRRVRLRGAQLHGRHTTGEWREKVALLGGCCIYCGRDDLPLTRDHKVPISRGGSDDITNVVPACMPCNRRKKTKTAYEFLARGVA